MLLQFTAIYWKIEISRCPLLAGSQSGIGSMRIARAGNRKDNSRADNISYVLTASLA
jgi:hypothetical protein